MKNIYSYLVFGLLVFNVSLLNAQNNKSKITEADKSSLEGIIVEKYYVNDSKDHFDTTGGAFPKGAVTYRIYVDMKPGYTLQAVYGVPKHKLTISTSTNFFNNISEGTGTGDRIYSKNINHNTVAFDSWLTIGAVTESHNGILLTEDTDGSIINKKCFKKADGLNTGKIKPVTYFGIDPVFFNTNNKASAFTTDNGSWAVFGGVSGPTESNKVLIAQLTTDGSIAFELNLQIGTPTGGSIQYVAKNAEDQEIMFPELIYQTNNNN